MPKRICFLIGDLSRSGGTERVTSEIANELSTLKDKYEIHILSLWKQGEGNFFKVNDQIIASVLFDQPDVNFKKIYLKIVQSIRKYMKDNHIDVLIDVDTVLDIFSIPATRFTKTKFIAWEHFNYYENLGVKFRDWGRKLSARFADAIVTITKEDRGYFEQNLKLKCPIYTIYNPITLPVTSTQYDLTSKTILSAGRLTYQKGFDLLLEVAKEVFQEHKDWNWIILGEGEERKELEQKIEKYQLQDHVFLKGNVNNIEDYYKDAAIFVLTSRYEGFGLVLTEAKSYRLPCVSFKCKAGPSEIILDNKNGYLIDSFNSKEMSRKICHLIEDTNTREKFSNHALDDTDKYLKNNVIQNWIDLLDQI